MVHGIDGLESGAGVRPQNTLETPRRVDWLSEAAQSDCSEVCKAERSVLLNEIHRFFFMGILIFDAVGKYKTDVVNGCRQAIRTNNLSGLIKVISTGEI